MRLVLHQTIILSENPFFDIYHYMLYHSIHSYRDKNEDISDHLFIKLFTRVIEYLSIDAIVYGLERGLIDEDMNDEGMVLSTILSIIDSIRLLLRYKEHTSLFISILIYMIISTLTSMTIERQGRKMPISYYPFSKDLMDMEEYILNTLLDLIASTIIKDKCILYDQVINGIRNELKDRMLLAPPTLVKIVILTTVLMGITDKGSKEHRIFNCAYEIVCEKIKHMV